MTLLDLLPFAVIAVAFWLLLIRPAKARRDAQAALVASLAPGQRVMTTAGVFGTVVAVDADRLQLQVAPGVVIEMVPQAIGQVVPEPTIDTTERPEVTSTEPDAASSEETDRG